jgi:hypothetical protein
LDIQQVLVKADGGTVMMKPENLIAFDGVRKLVVL